MIGIFSIELADASSSWKMDAQLRTPETTRHFWLSVKSDEKHNSELTKIRDNLSRRPKSLFAAISLGRKPSQRRHDVRCCKSLIALKRFVQTSLREISDCRQSSGP